MSLWIRRLTRHDYLIRSASSASETMETAAATFCFPSLVGSGHVWWLSGSEPGSLSIVHVEVK